MTSGSSAAVRGRVLVADDEPPVREFVTRALEHGGYEVVDAADGLEALERLADSGPFDLVISDIVMPGLDGIELALKLAKDRPDVRMLLMTGYAAEKQRAHNLDAITNRVIAKPFTLKQLLDTVRDIMASG